MELLPVETGDGGVAEFPEVVGQNLGGESDGDAFRALCQQEWEFHGQRDRLFVASVVGQFPLRGFGIEEHVEGEFGEARLDVTRCCRAITRQDVTPVSLTIHQQVFLSELHEGVADGGITVGVELHRVTDDVRHLVEAPVVEAFHGVEDASLHGFQSVAEVGHGAFENHVGGIVQEPVAVHSRQLVVALCISHGRGLIVGMGCGFRVLRKLLARRLVGRIIFAHGR